MHDGANQTLTKTWDVIFTVITSPDTPLANYWGHMEDYITVNGKKYSRPPLHSEAPLHSEERDDIPDTINRELWVTPQWRVAADYCNKLGELPTSDQLMDIHNAYPNGTLYNSYGWPVNYFDNNNNNIGNFWFWSSNIVGEGYETKNIVVDINNGDVWRLETGHYFHIICRIKN